MMSTTDKLAQLVQTFLVRYSPKDDPAPYAAKGLPQDPDDLAQQARDALAEYKASQSTPAGEVTAVEVARQVEADLDIDDIVSNGSRQNPRATEWYFAGQTFQSVDEAKVAQNRFRLKAILAAAHPALVQQVERLRIDVAASHSCLNELSAENARLKKLLKGARQYVQGRQYVLQQIPETSKDVMAGIKADLEAIDAAIDDAAAAQAKQSPEKIP